MHIDKIRFSYINIYQYVSAASGTIIRDPEKHTHTHTHTQYTNSCTKRIFKTTRRFTPNSKRSLRFEILYDTLINVAEETEKLLVNSNIF